MSSVKLFARRGGVVCRHSRLTLFDASLLHPYSPLAPRGPASRLVAMVVRRLLHRLQRRPDAPRVGTIAGGALRQIEVTLMRVRTLLPSIEFACLMTHGFDADCLVSVQATNGQATARSLGSEGHSSTRVALANDAYYVQSPQGYMVVDSPPDNVVTAATTQYTDSAASGISCLSTASGPGCTAASG